MPTKQIGLGRPSLPEVAFLFHHQHMNLLKDKAFLWASAPMGETKKRLTLFTQNQGFITGIIKASGPLNLWDLVCVWPEDQGAKGGLPRLCLEVLASHHHKLSRAMPTGKTAEAWWLLCQLPKLLPERHPYPAFFTATQNVFNAMGHDDFDKRFLAFQIFLLKTMGYGIDFDQQTVSLHGHTHHIQQKQSAWPSFLHVHPVDENLHFADNPSMAHLNEAAQRVGALLATHLEHAPHFFCMTPEKR